VKRTTTAVLFAGVVLVVIVGWLAWRSTEVETAAATAPTGASPPRVSARPLDGRSSAATDETPNEAPSPKLAKVDRSPVKGCALTGGQSPDCAFLEPDEETLLEMARCGIARLDAPMLGPPGSNVDAFQRDWLDRAGVSEAEHERLKQAVTAFRTQQRERWADLAVTAGIDRSWAEATTPLVIVSRIATEFEEDQVAAAMRRVARERAGLDPTGDVVPATLDAAVRLRVDAGDAFEAAIAEVVGEARAAELRAVDDGWPGAHSSMGNHCEREPIPVPERRTVRNTAEAQACVADIENQKCSFLDPSQLELDHMADCGIVRINIPNFISDRSAEPSFGEAWADSVGLSLEEEAVMAEVAEQYRENLYRELTELLLAIGKSQQWADQTSFLGMMAALHEASPMSAEEEEAMLRRLAAEKAGRIEPPADLSSLSIGERITRINVEFGDALEQALAARLGPERASELRHAFDGWPGPRLQGHNYCDGTEAHML
jgi:hypothetical protein